MSLNPSNDGRLDLEYKPRSPEDRTRGIGIVGAGEIVTSAHLPAYRMAGFRVIGIYDKDPAKAEAAVRENPSARAFPSLEALLEHPDVQIVDIAVPARFQPEIALEAARRGSMCCARSLWPKAMAKRKRSSMPARAMGSRRPSTSRCAGPPAFRRATRS
ncbi:Gfo/Idh/MocA family oxidoreductase [Paenibacillus sp. P25]|nr:Gfo/Idh/MocA family oxidoreductase [Paenibacillus sp. P25]